MSNQSSQNTRLFKILEQAKLQEQFDFYNCMKLILQGEELTERDISDLRAFQNFLIESTNQVNKIEDMAVYTAKMSKLKQLYPVHDLLAKVLGCLVIAKEANKKMNKRLIEKEIELNKLATEYNNLLNTLNL